MTRTLLAGILCGVGLLTGCSFSDEETLPVIPFPTVSSTGLPPPPNENIVPEQENGLPLPLPTDEGFIAEEELPPASPLPTPILVTPPPPEQLPTAQGDAQVAISVIVSQLVSYAGKSPESTVTLGSGVVTYAVPGEENFNVALPEGVILTIGETTLLPPNDPTYVKGNYCVSIPNPDNTNEYYVLTGSVLVQPSALPVVRKKSC